MSSRDVLEGEDGERHLVGRPTTESKITDPVCRVELEDPARDGARS